ncbi:cytochrome b [uncultured Sphingomonas sp.]|uniref:cytochrome b n=1 Tax=uncultured Sphingomonas sp. TaxID=158754 RepID=UPI0035CC13FF
MTLRGNAGRYGIGAATLHWVSAAAIVGMVTIGFVAANSADAERTAALLRVHVPLGLLVLALTLARLGWRLFDRRPAAPAGPRWQRIAGRLNHAALYGIVILMGVSGIGVMVLSGAAAILFSGATTALPRFFDFAPMKAHAFGAIVLVGLVGLHVGAAMYHQFYRRDHLLARMRIGSGDVESASDVTAFNYGAAIRPIAD